MPQLLRHIILIFSLTLLGEASFAQAKIGDNKKIIQSGSLLELESTNKGMLNVRMNTAQMLSIPVSSSSHGMMVYNTDSVCICLYDGSNWKNMCRGEKTRLQKAVYTASYGDSLFLCPDIIYDDRYVEVFRNGVQVNFTATVGTNKIVVEPDAVCDANDEIRIIQIVIQ